MPFLQPSTDLLFQNTALKNPVSLRLMTASAPNALWSYLVEDNPDSESTIADETRFCQREHIANSGLSWLSAHKVLVVETCTKLRGDSSGLPHAESRYFDQHKNFNSVALVGSRLVSSL